MIHISKEIFKKALLAGIFSAFTIGVLTILTYKSTLGLFIAGSFGSSMVLLFGFPESPFAQPKNVFFGHLVTALVGVVFVALVPLPIFVNIALAAANILGMDIAGVDLLESRDGPLVLEVNSSPGLEGIEGASRVNVAGAVAQHLNQRLQAYENQKTQEADIVNSKHNKSSLTSE